MPIVLGKKINTGRRQNRPELKSGKRYYVKTREIYNGVNVILSGIYTRDNAHNLIFIDLKLEQPVLDPRVRLPSKTEFFDSSVDIYAIPEQPVVRASPMVNNEPGPVVNSRPSHVEKNDPKRLEGGYTKNRKTRRTRRKQK